MSTGSGVLVSSATVAIYLVLIFAPGLLVGGLAGLRGWQLAGLAPLLSYALAGLAGPWYAMLGLPFNLAGFLVAVAVFAAVAFGLRRLAGRQDGPVVDAGWSRSGHLAVLGCLLLAAAIGGYTVLRGTGGLDAVAQGFDGVYHGNGIRYIAETGDGSLTGTGMTNWYAAGAGLFYPNAYHLVGSLVYRLSGADIPTVLNAGTVLLPGLLALSLVVLIRHFHGRAVFAGATALVAVAPVTLIYESLDHGPLLPFLLGLVLTPLGAVTLDRYLARPRPDTAFALIGTGIGLLTIHSSTLFTGILFATPLLIQRWTGTKGGRLRALGRDLRALWPVAAVSAALGWLQLSGALGLATGDVPYTGWPTSTNAAGALGTLLTFQHFEPFPQVWLTVALLVGVVSFQRLGALRWVAATALLTGVFSVAVASSDSRLVMELSRPWWDDPYRLLAIATVPLCLLAGHGIAETQRWLRDVLARRSPLMPATAAVVASVLMLTGFLVVTGGLYSRTNAAVIGPGYGPRPGVAEDNLPVSENERRAMAELGRLARPGDWAMNSRFDGTAWTYALSGVRTVAGHFDQGLQPPDAQLLAARFNRYPSDAAVREACARLQVHWVIVGRGGYPANSLPEPGLTGLDQASFLRIVYRNADAAVYQILGPTAPRQP